MTNGDELTGSERRLVEAVTAGDLLDLTGEDDPVLRSQVLRDILLGRQAPEPDPRGVRIRGARLDGPLDLSNISARVGLALVVCELRQPLSLVDTQLPWLVLAGTTICCDSGPAVLGERLRVDGVVFLTEGFEATGTGEQGTVQLSSAHIGHLSCAGAILRNSAGPALNGDGLKVDGVALFTDGFNACELASTARCGCSALGSVGS